MRIMRRAIGIAVAGAVIAVAAHAQLGLLGPKRPPPVEHPEGYYLLRLPRGWSHAFAPGEQFTASGTHGDTAQLTITVTDVEREADTELVALNAHRRLRELPHFKDGGGGRLTIGGKPASIRSFEFDYQGNTELTVAVEELYVVTGRILVTVHFEVMRRSLPAFKEDLKAIYDSLRVADVDAEGRVKRAPRPKQRRERTTVVPDISTFH